MPFGSDPFFNGLLSPRRPARDCPTLFTLRLGTIQGMDAATLLATALDPGYLLRCRRHSAGPLAAAGIGVARPELAAELLSSVRQINRDQCPGPATGHLYDRARTVLLLSPSLRQSGELFHKVLLNYETGGKLVKARSQTRLSLELVNGSRILCLPGKDQNIRGFSPELLIIDEAARVADDLYKSVRPMLAVSRGRLIAMSTPFGQRGWFFEEWQGAGPVVKDQGALVRLPPRQPGVYRRGTPRPGRCLGGSGV